MPDWEWVAPRGEDDSSLQEVGGRSKVIVVLSKRQSELWSDVWNFMLNTGYGPHTAHQNRGGFICGFPSSGISSLYFKTVYYIMTTGIPPSV